MILVEATEMMWRKVEGRSKSIQKSKDEKQNKEHELLKQVTAAEARAALAERRKAMQAAYEACKIAAHRGGQGKAKAGVLGAGAGAGEQGGASGGCGADVSMAEE
ncbi:hypothetical protein B0H14DRAFT_3526186 [Mycena olivaceomarginata]|nr:hypothetical protein B0H14DRAFT_3526186 [Mycena olivaceomarginata]